jgi:hypothetical protein
MAEKKSVFEDLYSVNVNGYTEEREGLTYLSWANAVAEVKKRYPDMTYEIEKFDNNLPFIYDELTGYMVFTKVTIGGITHEMWLPVMDSKNKAMKSIPYEYDTKSGKRTVQAATMFDINKTIMRCLTKNLAMFGLGLYVYSGEDLPEAEKIKAKEEADKAAVDELKELWTKAGGKEGFEDWFAKNTEKGFGNEQYVVMKSALLKKINDKEKK